MALLSALQCPLVGSQQRTVSAAAKTVRKDYNKFCFEQVGGPLLEAKKWDDHSGTFALSCFKDARPNIGYFIISAYQGLSHVRCPIKAGFASELERGIWESIGESLLYGLGLTAEEVKEPVKKQTGKELQKLLQVDSSQLEGYLLSIFKTADLQSASKKKASKRKHDGASAGEEGAKSQAQEGAVLKKARSVRLKPGEEGPEKVAKSAPAHTKPITPQKGPDAVRSATGISNADLGKEDRLELEEELEEIKAELDVRGRGASDPRSGPLGASEESFRDARDVARADLEKEQEPLQGEEIESEPDVHQGQRTSTPKSNQLDASKACAPPQGGHVPPSPQTSSPDASRRSPSPHVGLSKARSSSPDSRTKTFPRRSTTPPLQRKNGTSRGVKGNLKEALSKLSPNSKQQRVKKSCPHCKTLMSIRVNKCPNSNCGQKVENKAAKRRAAVRERKLAQKVTFKKAWEETLIAAKRVHNCKFGGARLAVLAMKGGENVDSVMYFGLGGGLRFASSKKVQASFTNAISEEIAEEKKARKAAAEAAKAAAAAAAAAKAQQSPLEGSADGAQGGGSAESLGALPTEKRSDQAAVPDRLLASIVDSMQIPEDMKRVINEGLAKHEFDLKTAKETSTTEFATLFPTLPFAKLKALVGHIGAN